jgi:hypothetical protein
LIGSGAGLGLLAACAPSAPPASTAAPAAPAAAATTPPKPAAAATAAPVATTAPDLATSSIQGIGHTLHEGFTFGDAWMQA